MSQKDKTRHVEKFAILNDRNEFEQTKTLDNAIKTQKTEESSIMKVTDHKITRDLKNFGTDNQNEFSGLFKSLILPGALINQCH